MINCLGCNKLEIYKCNIKCNNAVIDATYKSNSNVIDKIVEVKETYKDWLQKQLEKR
jgi:hypothetical protein